MSAYFDQVVIGYRLVQLMQGESIQEFAFRTLNDASRWPDIVNLNKLLPPYVTGDSAVAASGRVALYGVTLLVPSAVETYNPATSPDTIFETDVMLTNGLLTVNSNGGLDKISGRQNLVQALQNALTTHTGDLIFHPDYGCLIYKLLGTGATNAVAFLARGYASQTVAADPRINEVVEAHATVSGDVVRVSVQATPVVGPKVSVST